MRLHLASAAVLVAVTGLVGFYPDRAAHASPCARQIDSLSGRVRAETTEAIAANTSGQGAAAKRGGEGLTGTEGRRASESPQAPPEKSVEAGEGADAAQQARVALDQARAAEARGDEKGCEAAVDRVKAELGKTR